MTTSMDDPRTRNQRRLAALRNERNSWESTWTDLSNYLWPGRLRLPSIQKNNGQRKDDKIIDNTPLRAVRILAAGMMAGITSPARPWFRLTTPDPAVAESGTVKEWLHAVEERLRQAIAKSNIYNVLPSLYQDIGVFGTACGIIEEDEQDGIRGYVFPVGSYYLANSPRQQVDTMFREVPMTVVQIVERFGLGNCSKSIQDQYERKNYDQWIDVIHAIEPNRDRESDRKDYRGMPFKSCWYEKNRSIVDEGYLREGGYRQFPVLAPRWDITGGDVYGRGPGHVALGDAKALQLFERRKLEMVDKIANPPMRGPASLRNWRTSLRSGDVTYTPDGSQAKFEPAIVIDPNGIKFVNESAAETRERINAAMYADLWLLLADSDRRQITAREVDELHEEKMLQLGPVLERLEDELLDPLIDRIFEIENMAGRLPPPPPELQGTDLRIEYISIMAQAQKLLGTVAVERLSGFTGNLAAVNPEVVDKLNMDKMVDEYGGMLGVKPDLIRTEDEVQQLRAARQQQQQQAAAMEQAQQGAQAAQTLSQADMQGDNALTRLLRASGAPAGGAAA